MSMEDDSTILQRVLMKIEQRILRLKAISFIVFLVGTGFLIFGQSTLGAIFYMISYAIIFIEFIL